MPPTVFLVQYCAPFFAAVWREESFDQITECATREQNLFNRRLLCLREKIAEDASEAVLQINALLLTTTASFIQVNLRLTEKKPWLFVLLGGVLR
jgi:hypothetical protein